MPLSGYPEWRRKFEVCSGRTRTDSIAEGKGLEISGQHTDTFLQIDFATWLRFGSRGCICS